VERVGTRNFEHKNSGAQWTDEGGKIKTFVTPGGHRRYSRTELKRFRSSRARMLGIKDLVIELEDTAQLRREIARTSLSKKPWYRHLNEDLRRHLDKNQRLLHKIHAGLLVWARAIHL